MNRFAIREYRRSPLLSEADMSNATLLVDGAWPAVRLERHLPDPPSIVWQAITDRERLRSWFPCDVAVAGGRWEVGAAITFLFPPEVIDMTLTGEVLAVDEPSALAFSWGDEILRFELSATDNGGTRLILINELTGGIAARNAAGWEVCLNRLVGLDPSADSWRSYFETYVVAFEPTLGPQEGPPAGYKGD
jgi:uncharacterized protein YndB with AHSA1/START domain